MVWDLLELGVLTLKEVLIVWIIILLQEQEIFDLVFLHSLKIVLWVTHLIIRNLIIIRTFEKVVRRVATIICNLLLAVGQISISNRLINIYIVYDVRNTWSTRLRTVFEAWIFFIFKEKTTLIVSILKRRRNMSFARLEHLQMAFFKLIGCIILLIYF